MNRTFWMVWNEEGRTPTYKHESEQSAKREAERLTRLHGGKFHVLKLVTTCQDVMWSTPNDPAMSAAESSDVGQMASYAEPDRGY